MFSIPLLAPSILYGCESYAKKKTFSIVKCNFFSVQVNRTKFPLDKGTQYCLALIPFRTCLNNGMENVAGFYCV